MKKMKTFWMDSNLARLMANLFPNKNQGEFIRKSVEQSMERALKRVWNPIGYISETSGFSLGTYCFKYFYGFYPKLRRQFVFISDIDGTSFINMFPESKNLLFEELSIMPDEEVDILFMGYDKTVSVSQDLGKSIWNVLVLDAECLARNIDLDYKAFVEVYVGDVKMNTNTHGQLRYFGVRAALGFSVDYDFDNYNINHVRKLTGHLDIVDLPDNYKRPDLKRNIRDIGHSKELIYDNYRCELETDLFCCRAVPLGIDVSELNEPFLYFSFEFKKNNIIIYPGYMGWLSFCDGIINTVISKDNKLKSMNFDSVYAIIDSDLCIFRGMKFDMNITSDNMSLQEFINQYINLPEYKKLISNYEDSHKLWVDKKGDGK